MRVPRHWRMKQQQYQLTGTRNSDGKSSLIARPEKPVQHVQAPIASSDEVRENAA